MASVFKRGGKRNRGGCYYMSWWDHNGKRHTRSSRTTDKSAAERIAAKLEADAALRRDGVIDPALDAIGQQARRSIEDHLADYEAKLRAAGRDPKHIATTLGYIRTICEAAGFHTAADVTADGVNAYAGQLRERWSARTVQAYLTAIKGFTRWMTAHGKLAADPLASVQRPNPKANRRRERRMLLPDEWQWLRSVTLTEAVGRYAMPAAERVLLYATAIQTGLRSSELRSLTRGRLSLEGEQPYITCKAGSTKNSKHARQYIQPELAAEFRQHIATKAPGARVFAMPPKEDVAAMLRSDLADARRAWLKTGRSDPKGSARRQESDFLEPVNHESECLDFHSLRHTCGAWLAKAGAHPKAVQSVMRHSTITLTMDTYGHLFPGQEAETISRFPNMLSEEPEAMRATGTDDAMAKGAAHAQQLGRDLVPDDATGRANEKPAPKNGTSPNPLRAAGLCEAMRDRAKRRARDSNG